MRAGPLKASGHGPRIAISMLELTRKQARDRVQAAGMRATGPRVAVLRVLTASDRPLSHAEVAAALSDGDLDKATVYRNLIRLVEGNLARVASQVGGITRYEASTDGKTGHMHPHFACKSCGTVECLPDASISLPRDAKWRVAMANAELQVVGQCPTCREPVRPKRRAAGERARP